MSSSLSLQETFIHPNLKLLSNNSQLALHKCPRFYELYKLLDSSSEQKQMLIQSIDDFLSSSITEDGEEVDQGERHLSFGDLVGFGVQRYFFWLSNSTYLNAKDVIEQVQLELWLRYDYSLEEDNERAMRDKKTFIHALYSVEKLAAYYSNNFEFLQLFFLPSGEPATELGMTIDLGNGWKTRGFTDLVVKNSISEMLGIIEVKTTKNSKLHAAMYQNSGQAIGYDLVLETLASELQLQKRDNFELIFLIYVTSSKEWKHFEFLKTRLQRGNWLRTLMSDMKDIISYSEASHFPMRGENCFAFYKPCKYFEICEMSNDVLLGDIYAIPEKEEKGLYKYNYTVEQIIDTLASTEEQGEKHG